MVVCADYSYLLQGVQVMILSRINFWFRHTRLTPRAVCQMRAVSLHSGRDCIKENRLQNYLICSSTVDNYFVHGGSLTCWNPHLITNMNHRICPPSQKYSIACMCCISWVIIIAIIIWLLFFTGCVVEGQQLKQLSHWMWAESVEEHLRQQWVGHQVGRRLKLRWLELVVGGASMWRKRSVR